MTEAAGIEFDPKVALEFLSLNERFAAAPSEVLSEESSEEVHEEEPVEVAST